MWPFSYARDLVREIARIPALLAAIATALSGVVSALWAIQAELKGMRDDQTKIVAIKATQLETKERP